uniref:Uncharacterized protein n=1 Tax=Ditylenchus dipsaci TaxID=166011 RepID=A0A915CNY5_9BILA
MVQQQKKTKILERKQDARENACYMRQHKKQATFSTQVAVSTLHKPSSNISRLKYQKLKQPKCVIHGTIHRILFFAYLCNTNFDEVAHFRYFLPNDPILKPMQQGSKEHEKHYLIPKSLNGLPLRNGCRTQFSLQTTFLPYVY